MTTDAQSNTKTFLTDYDLHLLMEGQHYQAWKKLGAHPGEVGGKAGVWFTVWAPNARSVAVIGDFNDWDRTAHPMRSRGDSGVWETFVPDAAVGARYKYLITGRDHEAVFDKADPYGFASELRPQTASVVWDLGCYRWGDQAWMRTRAERNGLERPISIYEVHLASWRRKPEEGDRWLTYRETAHQLADYVREMGFTHVELMPVSEHPLDSSWGYQCIGYYAPTSRFGSPDDFRYLVDTLHQAGIGVILDWVPAHFPRDAHGLGFFDGTHLYEHADPRQREQPDWGTFVFNYGRNEVANFLLSNALFWMEEYHIDGLRVDAVASMLYLDYSRQEGEWIPNRYGGRENLEAIAFLKRLNELVFECHPDVMMIAEESTAWPIVSRPTHLGGLGFNMKWNMGWMHDTLDYISRDPIHRRFHHSRLTFSLLYAFHENFILPFSHDEVVHGKGSMIGKMPGDDWQRFANLRLLYGYMFAHPGKKLLFMGNEFGQWSEWNHSRSLDWHLLQDDRHAQLQRWVRDLNTFLRGESALHRRDVEPSGFQWIDCNDSEQSVLAFLRRGDDASRPLVFVCNFTPIVRPNYRLGVPADGYWEEALNSDAPLYGGSGQGNLGGAGARPVGMHGFRQSLNVTLPPLAVLAFRLR